MWKVRTNKLAQVHVTPDGDSFNHDLESYDCFCGPIIGMLDAYEMLVVHHSLDGREDTNNK